MRAIRSKRQIIPDSSSDSETRPVVTIQDTNVKIVSVTPALMGNIKESVERTIRTNPHLLKDVVRQVLIEDPSIVRNALSETNDESEPIPYREIDKTLARKEILEYVRIHPGSRTSEIIELLNLDPLIVADILKELREEGSVKSKAIESRSNDQL